MKVKKAKAVQLFQALAIRGADGFSKDKLAELLNSAPVFIEEGGPFELEEGEDKELLDDVLEALRDGQTIKVIEETSSPEEDGTPDSDVEVPVKVSVKKEKKVSATETVEKKGKKGKKANKDLPEKAEKKGNKAAKAEKGKPGRKADPDKPSNKAVIYKAWTKSKDKSTKTAQELCDLVNGEVKLTTVKSWIGGWNRGQNLPGIAKK